MKRRLIYAGILTVLLAGALWTLRRPREGGEAPVAAMPEGLDAQAAHPEPAAPQALRAPPSAVAELAVLTERPESGLAGVIDREAVAGLLQARHCGDEAACEAVRRALRDERATRLQIEERADAARSTRVVSIRVTTEAGDRHLALRTAFAAAAAIAEKIDGRVEDRLLGRTEDARAFGAHAFTAPLGASAFRNDRVQLVVQPRAEGVVRIVTAGLSRWAAPDVEAPAVPAAAAARVGDIVLGIAETLANAAQRGPIVLSREDVARARGAPYPGDAGLPDVQPVTVGLVSVDPDGGDAGAFVARVVPPAGGGPMGFLDLAERFFGPSFATAPVEEAARADAGAGRAQKLADALAKWKAAQDQGQSAKLLARLPFPIPGAAGSEMMWIEVTGFDDRTVKGTVVDEPLAATDVAKGAEVTRRRGEVLEVRER